jgi:uncharacterized protein YaiL (DUF2058 family)
MADLRKQLLKAGLIDKKAKQKADTEARRKKKRKRKKGKGGGPDAEERRQQEEYDRVMAEKAEADRAIEKERQEAGAVKERDNRVRNLAGAWAIREAKPGRRRWFFVRRDGIIRWFDVGAELAWRLELGAVAVVERPGDPDEPFAMVPRDVAERISGIEPQFVRFWNREGPPDEEEA